MLRRLLAITCILVLAAGLSGCIRITGEFPASELESRTMPATAAAESPSTKYGLVGEKLNAGAWAVRVEDAKKTSEKVAGVKPAEGCEFLVVDVGFQNNGTDALQVRAEDCKLTDSAGKAVALAEISQPAFNARSMRPLLPRFGTSTAFVYQIPKGRAHYTFSFKPRGTTKKTPLEWLVP